MPIYKVLVSCSKRKLMTSPGGYNYMEDLHAYAEYQYFSTLDKAQIFIQRYSEEPVIWEALDDECWTTSTPHFKATIFLEKDAYFDTAILPPLPTKFAARHQFGD